MKMGLGMLPIISVKKQQSSWKDPLWWDIYNIIKNDETPGYIAKFIYLFSDEWMTINLQGADAYRTSDGAFYQATSLNEKIVHTWQPTASKPDSTGHGTRYIIRYWKSATASSLTIGISPNNVGGYPIYMIAKDATISTGNFPSISYVLKGYDHINCKYNGSSLSAFFNNNNHLSLVHIPNDWEFTGNIVTVGNAFNCPRFTKIDYSSIPMESVTGNGAPIVQISANSVTEMVGTVINLAGRTNEYLLNATNLVEARFANINCNFSFNNGSSLISKATLESIKAALVDRTGLEPLVFNAYTNGRTFPQEWWDEIRAKNWTVTGTFE